MKKKLWETIGYFLHIATIIVYFILVFTLNIKPPWAGLTILAFICFGLGFTFLILSITTHLHEKQETVFNQGVYGIVRHPMYLGAIFLFIAIALFLPVYVMVGLAFINVLVIIWFIKKEELENRDKFGEAYQRYQAAVPKINFITGLYRWFSRNRTKRQ